MRLCIVGNPNSIHVKRWVRYFAHKHEVHFVGVRKPTEIIDEPIIFHDLSKTTYLPKVRYIAWSLQLKRILAKIRPDVLHAHWIAGAGWICAASGYHPFLVTVHGSDLLVLPKESKTHHFLAQFVLSRSDYVTCVSDNLYRELCQFGVDKEKLEVVKLGVDITVFRPLGDPDIKKNREAGDGDPVIISLRPVRPIYNPLDIAEAMTIVTEKVPKARFIVLTYNADPELFIKFRNILTQSGLDKSVTFVEELKSDSEIARLYQQADIGISVASSDGTPISVQEAMACGLAMILGDIPTLRDWVRHEQEALFVPLNSPLEIAEKIVHLLNDPGLRETISQNAVKAVRLEADSQVWMKRAESIYEMLSENATG